jgi:hypothetical protein
LKPRGIDLALAAYFEGGSLRRFFNLDRFVTVLTDKDFDIGEVWELVDGFAVWADDAKDPDGRSAEVSSIMIRRRQANHQSALIHLKKARWWIQMMPSSWWLEAAIAF